MIAVSPVAGEFVLGVVSSARMTETRGRYID
jgi:hypothetical protein